MCAQCCLVQGHHYPLPQVEKFVEVVHYPPFRTQFLDHFVGASRTLRFFFRLSLNTPGSLTTIWCRMKWSGTQPHPRRISQLLSAPLTAQTPGPCRSSQTPWPTCHKKFAPPGVWSTSQGCVHDIKESVLHPPALIFIRLADSRPGVGGVELPADWLIS